jgi:hypothetical protein
MALIGVLYPMPSRQVWASASPRALLDQAVNNTNAVDTLVYTTHGTQRSSHLLLHVAIVGQEDEIHNREQDHESLTATGKRSDGTPATINYTVDVIFVGGKTYFRRSIDNGRWRTLKGMDYRDSYAGIEFRRGRTKLGYGTSLKFVQIDQVGGVTHLRAAIGLLHDQGTDDVYISGGTKPYVVRVDTTRTAIQNGLKVVEQSRTDYGPFNQTLVITPPTGAST